MSFGRLSVHPVSSLRVWHFRHSCFCKITKCPCWASSSDLLVAGFYAAYFHFHSRCEPDTLRLSPVLVGLFTVTRRPLPLGPGCSRGRRTCLSEVHACAFPSVSLSRSTFGISPPVAGFPEQGVLSLLPTLEFCRPGSLQKRQNQPSSWELSRNADSQAAPRSIASESLGVGPRNLGVDRLSGETS